VNSVLRISLATLGLIASPGCSLIYTKGPEPEVHPPPECTTSNAAPVADTVLAATSVALFGLGVAGVVISLSGPAVACPVSGCNNSGREAAVGVSASAIAVGAAMGVLFTTSAVVGYRRTGACRDSLAPDASPLSGPAVPAASLLPVTPWEACGRVGDAPRVCARVVPLQRRE
jgi:hypothetical protein